MDESLFEDLSSVEYHIRGTWDAWCWCGGGQANRITQMLWCPQHRKESENRLDGGTYLDKWDLSNEALESAVLSVDALFRESSEGSEIKGVAPVAAPFSISPNHFRELLKQGKSCSSPTLSFYTDPLDSQRSDNVNPL